MDQNDQVDRAQLQLGTAQHHLSLNYDADPRKAHSDCKDDDQPKRGEKAKPRL